MATPFPGLTEAQLEQLRAAYLNSYLAIAASGHIAGYTLNGRSVNYRNLPEIEASLNSILSAQAVASGDAPTSTLISFTGL